MSERSRSCSGYLDLYADEDNESTAVSLPKQLFLML